MAAPATGRPPGHPTARAVDTTRLAEWLAGGASGGTTQAGMHEHSPRRRVVQPAEQLSEQEHFLLVSGRHAISGNVHCACAETWTEGGIYIQYAHPSRHTAHRIALAERHGQLAVVQRYNAQDGVLHLCQLHVLVVGDFLHHMADAIGALVDQCDHMVRSTSPGRLVGARGGHLERLGDMLFAALSMAALSGGAARRARAMSGYQRLWIDLGGALGTQADHHHDWAPLGRHAAALAACVTVERHFHWLWTSSTGRASPRGWSRGADWVAFGQIPTQIPD